MICLWRACQRLWFYICIRISRSYEGRMKANKQTKKMLPARKCYVTKSVFETIKFLLKNFMEGRTVCHIINVIFKK